jgi:predicted nucleic acid-binding protein
LRIIIDTNIFIFRENYAVLPENLQNLLGLLQRSDTQIVLHPLSVKEIEKDNELERRAIVLSKIKTYQMIEKPPLVQDDEAFTQLIGKAESENQLVDDNLLYCIFRDTADYLITEDKGIHSKSKQLGLSHRVLTTDQALDRFKSQLRTNPITSPPAVKEIPVYSLRLDDPIFDSLKIEYARTKVPFPEWWAKISRQGRKAWVYYHDEDTIGAILIYKPEDEAVWSNPPLPPRKRLKINTLKVAPTETGQKIGELFIKMSVEFAMKNDIYELYLTRFSRPDDDLVKLIEEFGFFKTATIDGEDVYLKKLIPEGDWNSPYEVAKRYYPSFYDGRLVKKFMIPILPEYHERLFTDYQRRQPTMPEYGGQFIVEGNTIKKAYLSHSKVHGMAQGDILLFYRSRDEMSVVTLGVVERVYHSQDPKRIAALTAKRTVYPFKEIQRFAKKPTKIILFRGHFHMRRSLGLNYLIENGIVSQAPLSILGIPHSKYVRIKEACGIDQRFTVD